MKTHRLSRWLAPLLATLALALPAASALAQAKGDFRIGFQKGASLLVLQKAQGSLEKKLAPLGFNVKWVEFPAGPQLLEGLNVGAVDFGFVGEAPPIFAQAAGAKFYYIGHDPAAPLAEAIVVRKDSAIKSVVELKGKKVAATKGTDPYLFLLRALPTAGLKRSDIEHVALQHADGRTALEQGRVDAWAGLDPLVAASELDAGSRLIYRNVAFNTYGFLNVREDFLTKQPETVRRVIAGYERARKWILANTVEAAKILSEEAKVSLQVALLQIKLRTDLSNPQPSSEHVQALQAAAPILLEEGLVKPGTNLNKVVTDLVDTRFALSLLQRAA